ncbi:MAG TPA: uracil-DNA glycosylase family protein [Gemmatimonadaceae bacterium]|nr:uracil-DNA glycosylase family protein [Gemmatimonadaceae bacterium]
MPRRIGRPSARELRVLLDDHARELSACRRCTFQDPAIRPVISSSREPLAMLVGQAPGRTEVVDRRPFAGRAGRTMFRWFADVGISEPVARRRIYIAAVTRCFPGSHPSGRGDRVPSPFQMANCGSWLTREIELVAPRVIILVGRLAIARFLDERPLNQLVGEAHRVSELPGSPLAIPLPHPSGASSWIHEKGHAELVRQAMRLIASQLPELVHESERERSVA